MEGEILEAVSDVEGEKEPSGRREKPVVRPEEIPPVPENRFLLRRDMPSQDDKTEMSVFSEYISAYTFNSIHLSNYRRCLL